MTEKKRKTFYWLFKVLSILVSCALPIFAIWEKFPIWTYTHGTTRSVGVGGIIALTILLLVFRKSVFKFLEEKMRLKYAPPIVAPMVALIISYILIYINEFLTDLNTVFWMWLVGCAVGIVLTYIAEHRYGNKEEEKDG